MHGQHLVAGRPRYIPKSITDIFVAKIQLKTLITLGINKCATKSTSQPLNSHFFSAKASPGKSKEIRGVFYLKRLKVFIIDMTKYDFLYKENDLNICNKQV